MFPLTLADGFSSLLYPTGLFSIFWPILVMLLSGWSLLILWFFNCSRLFTNLLGIVHQLQLVSPSPTCPIASLALEQGPYIYISLQLHLILLCSLPGRKKPLFSSFSFIFLTIIKSARLAEITWFDCISDTQRSLCIIFFFGTDSSLCIYLLFVWLNVNFLHNS